MIGGGSSNTITTGNTTLQVTSNGVSLNTGSFSVQGDSIRREYILRGTTTSNVESEIFFDNINRIPIPANTTVYYTVDVVARRTNGAASGAAFHLKGVGDNYSGTVRDIGTLYEIIVARDDANYLVDMRANNTTKSINMYVGGDTGQTIRWVAYVQTVEVAQ